MMMRARTIFFALFLFLYFPFQLFGQRQQEVPVTLESPYNTMLVHLHYLQPDSYEPALAARTLYGVPDSAQAVKLAIKLKQVLDGKGLYVRMGVLPRDSNYVDSTSNQNVYTPFPRQLPEVYLERINDRWYYSGETVGLIPQLHKEVYPFGADFLLNLLPHFGQRKVLGLAIWQYLGLLAILLLAVLVHFILSRILRPIVRRLSRSRVYPSLVPPKLIWKIARAASVMIVIRLIQFFLPALQLPIESANFAVIVIRLVGVILVIYILLRGLDIFILYADKFTQRTESKMDEQLLPMLRRGIQFLLFLAGIIQALRILQADVTTLIAGISIGGLALALAAQDTLKNLFGSLTIFMDRPFQIGDWINFSGVDGTVEEVGFRSTRVRTFSNSLVYVPNGKLADMVVDNYGLRAYRRFNTSISITYDTPPALVEKFVEGLRAIVANHPQTRKDYFEIHLNEMSASSLNILFYIFFAVPSWTEELKAKHEVLLAVMELAQALGVRFAFPTQTLHVEELPGATSLAPHYKTDPKAMDEKMKAFLEGYKMKVGRSVGH
ncbi:MAG: mechanosensitive ion channel family protein [Phaeodactylibacter sp.]|nr:mechanosensitive ion channel family protein [Phaeodactylibacter sp.]MCB9301911.1 mechanosensitive ion channel family protein [Lewinellaceae bacterium]